MSRRTIRKPSLLGQFIALMDQLPPDKLGEAVEMLRQLKREQDALRAAACQAGQAGK